jgi:hypothetical protein
MAIASAEPKLTPALVTDIEVEEADMEETGERGTRGEPAQSKGPLGGTAARGTPAA